jgi:AcrR family transcriptional regulator
MSKVSGATSAVRPRDRILNTASRLFNAEGMRAVGIDRVIDEAKVAKATLYSHFRSKNDLIEAYLRLQADIAGEDLQRIESSVEPGLPRVAALFDAVEAAAGQADYHGCCFINAAAEHLDPGSRAYEIIAEHRQEVLNFLERNAIRTDAAERVDAAKVVMALLDGLKVASVNKTAAFSAVRRVALHVAAGASQ